MNERFFYLLEKYLAGELSGDENSELEIMIQKDPDLEKELNEQKQVKEVLSKMELKNPPREFWDKYWINTYNRAERKFAWILVVIGSVVLISFAAIEAVEQFISDMQTPFLIKAGIAALTAGVVILLISVVREKLSTYKNDRYKEIQR